MTLARMGQISPKVKHDDQYLFRNLRNKLWHATLEMEEIPEFFRKLFYPSTLGSFRSSGELKVTLHGAETKELVLKNIFPFMTLQDIKIAIYIELKEEFALPIFQYLCVHGSEKGKTFLGKKTLGVDFTWASHEGIFLQANPSELAAGSKIDPRFVESNGERKLINPIFRERVTIEDAFFKMNITNARETLKEFPELHVYFYKDLQEAIPGAKPPSEKDWNGRLYPFFPYLSVNAVLKPEQKTAADRLATVFTRRQQFLMRLQSLLDESIPMIPLQLAGIKYLQLIWTKYGRRGIEAQFYEAPVNERRPFLRLIPVEGSGTSKIYLADGKHPDIQDPKMLVSWAEERNPTPEEDYAFAKILLRRGYLNVRPIYGTLRLLNDGTADFIVEPPKEDKKLKPDDLPSFGENLIEGVKEFSFSKGVPDIKKATFLMGFRLEKDKAPFTARSIRERLPVFTSFFQEIAPLAGENPLITLRYKLVSNFDTEDRIQTFLTQVINRKVVRGDDIIPGLVELVADEFQIDVDKARNQVKLKLTAQAEVAVVNPATKDYIVQNNTGIDVAFFAQHPFYTFHLYNVDSLENLRRVITALSLMVSANTEDLKVSAKAAKELQVELPQPIVEEAVEEAVESNNENNAEARERAEYLDFFSYEDETLDEAHGEEIQGTPYPEIPSDESPAPAPVAAPIALEEIKRDLVPTNPKVELEDLETPTTEGGIANFLINKLKQADRRLFDYKSPKRYVSQCQRTAGRQPAVLSESQYQRMVDEYAGDPVYFQLFPLQPGESEKVSGDIDVDYFTVLRYGTSPQNQNYYICCRYFCTKDEIMVREVDLKSEEMRQPRGAKKLPGECPFCRGKIITDVTTTRPGETIIERVMNKTNKRHLYVGWLKKPDHPDGFSLPCCFAEGKPILSGDPAFDKYRQWGVKTKPEKFTNDAETKEEELSESEDEGTREAAGFPISDYYVMLASVTKKYIVDAEKLPLDVTIIAGKARGEAQVGLLPAVLDKYFNQESTQIVGRVFNQQKIKDDATGFLRIGVENRIPYKGDSFLAAIAPFYRLNSAKQMKAFLLEKITPRVFMALNYGNLLLEFYDPSDKRPPRNELKHWASEELDVTLHEENEAAVNRAYLSYAAFEEWLKSDKTKKEFRHFALVLAQSNLIRRGIGPGTTFIVLDMLESGEVSVRCPPFGYNAEIMSGNNIGFLLHHWSGIWEPIFYVDNRPVEQRGIDIFTLTFQMTDVPRWPPIVRQRLQEYMAQCSSSARGAYTTQSRMNPLAMIPASIAHRILRQNKSLKLEGVVRDSYNHMVALLYRDKQKSDGYIPLPISDDGQLFISQDIFLDWDDPEFKRVPLNVGLDFYKTHVEKRFSLYPGFSPLRKVESRNTGIVEAMQLRNGLYVPVAPPTIDISMGTIKVDEMEWSLNHEICLEEKSIEIPGEKARMKTIEFQEIFEHLRLTFSNWLAAKEDGGDFRRLLESIIFSRLPLFEKRKRMEMELGPIIQKWITTDYTSEDEKRKHETSLLRVDCRLREKEACGGRCVWRQDQKCLLHVPKKTGLGDDEKTVSAPRVILLRLGEELLRYGERRRQLLEQDVSRISSLEKPVTVEGNQRIYPEKSAEWYELLRLEWATKKDEVPIFYEEMSKEETAAPPLEKQEEELPASLQLLLNGGAEPDPKTGALRLFRAKFDILLVALGLTPAQLSIEADTTALTDEMIRTILHAKGVPVIQIDLRPDPPTTIAKRPVRPSAPGIPVFIILQEGPALLMRGQPELLKREDMPRGLLDILSKAKGVLGRKA